jgi:hypothetical protein
MRGGVGFVAAARGNERLREGAAVRQWTGDSNFFVSGADIAGPARPTVLRLREGAAARQWLVDSHPVVSAADIAEPACPSLAETVGFEPTIQV